MKSRKRNPEAAELVGIGLKRSLRKFMTLKRKRTTIGDVVKSPEVMAVLIVLLRLRNLAVQVLLDLPRKAKYQH